jgi:LAO/AO transport system kinase
MLAGAGDELQGIKRGIMEMADVLVINKADGDNIAKANLARKAYENALHLFSPRDSGWLPPVLTCSSLTGNGIDKVWAQINEYTSSINSNGVLFKNREDQKKHWFENRLNAEIMHRIKENKKLGSLFIKVKKDVVSDTITPHQGVKMILDKIFN